MSRDNRDKLVGSALLIASAILLVVYAVGVRAQGQWTYTFWFVQQWFN